MKVAVIGATGMVGEKMIEVLLERNFPFTELIPVASERSAGKYISINNREGVTEKLEIITLDQALDKRPTLALFSAGGEISAKWAPKFAEVGTTVIDNSSFWRMDDHIKLIVPEVNGEALTGDEKIIANPNCSTIQMVVALNNLHKKLKIKRVVASTYQSVTGSGKEGLSQLRSEREQWLAGDADQVAKGDIYPHKIDLNLIPHIDSFTKNGYTKEEIKLIEETKKIFNDPSIEVTATAVRVPVEGGHSESVNVTFHNSFDMSDIFSILRETPGVILIDNPESAQYPMPLYAEGSDNVFVGRVRQDFSTDNSINLWIVADNLRRGAATNAVMIAEIFNFAK